ncbi:ribosomal RNA small subunit methyltransferase A [Candidatus Peregrinibacteria bacterium]|nr:ribosomal RNA small subunit methyltransferase A [Candidatus Peregrinibacteria bacterium]
MELYNLSTIKAILEKHGLWAKKYFGQNFLINREILEKIVEMADLKSTDEIIEIGPGLGVLTKELAKNAKHVTTLELDARLMPVLKNTLADYKNITILNQDALRFSPALKQYKVVANIPYNITSPLINLFLQTDYKPTSMTVLVQKEVAEKICLIEPDMTVLSLQVAVFGQSKLIRNVSAGCFYPAPKVDSAILQIQIYQPSDPNFIETKKALKILSLAKKAFSQRRKMLSNTLTDYKNQMTKVGIDLSRRPETLSIKEWLSLVD